MECRFSVAAESDLEEIADYIASDNPRRALSFVQEIRERCQNLTQFPEAVPLREALGPAIRVVAFGRYVIFISYVPMCLE